MCIFLLFYCFWICLNICTCKYPKRMLISLGFMHSISSPVFPCKKNSFTNAFSQKLLIFVLQHKISNIEAFWNSVLQLHSKLHTDRRIVNFTIHVLYEILIIIIVWSTSMWRPTSREVLIYLLKIAISVSSEGQYIQI